MDWQLTCRVCLESGDMVSLFDWDENKKQLGDKYTYCCGIAVSSSDSLPTLICLNCVDKLTLAYQFKQECISSNDTLKECLQEFKKSSAAVATTSEETETITIKQGNGTLLQYELPIENDPDGHWIRSASAKKPESVEVTKAPGPRKRGRPRKYSHEQGHIDISRGTRKKEKQKEKEEESLTQLLANDSLTIKDEPDNDHEPFEDFLGDDDDPDFDPQEKDEVEKPDLRKRGRPRKNPPKVVEQKVNGEDMLLKETIMAFSEPISEDILNPKPRKYAPKKKKYANQKMYTCETCGSSFTSNASLQGHIRRHLGIKPFVCSLCGYACVLNMELRRHMLRHTGQRPYKCRICDQRFAEFGSRQKHESVCGFATNVRLGLRRHMIRHTDVKKHKCRHCERRFHSKGDQQRHERVHMGVRPYQCSLCGKTFTYAEVLRNHTLTHTGEKNYACTLCNKKFTKAHHLKYHNKVHHKELYEQQQLEAEAKKVRQKVNVFNVFGLSGVVSGHIVDGQLQLVQGIGSDDGEYEGMEVVIEEEVEETDRAVAGIQEVVLDADFMEEESN